MGNSARICLRRVWWSGVRDGRCRSESVGWESGTLRAEGARKMAFSVLAWTDERWVVRRRSVERLGSWSWRTVVGCIVEEVSWLAGVMDR